MWSSSMWLTISMRISSGAAAAVARGLSCRRGRSDALVDAAGAAVDDDEPRRRSSEP